MQYTHRHHLHTLYAGNNTFTLCNGKAWVWLFTCCVTRAVHLDVVTDLSSQSFLRCLKTFIARRGLPSRIVLHNGTTFKGASKSIHNIMDYLEGCRFMSGVNVKWDFNIERAPCWGGLFKRMVQLLTLQWIVLLLGERGCQTLMATVAERRFTPRLGFLSTMAFLT